MRQSFSVWCSLSPECPLADSNSSFWIYTEQGSLLITFKNSSKILQKSEDNDQDSWLLQTKSNQCFNYSSWEFIQSPIPMQITSSNAFLYILRHDPRLITIFVLQEQQTIASVQPIFIVHELAMVFTFLKNYKT